MEREDAGFAPYEPRRPGGERAGAPAGLRVRPAAPADRDALARLVFEQDGGVYEEHLRGAGTELASERDDNLLLVAEAGGRLAGFARARFFAPPAEAPADAAPRGWYLLGVIVSPAFRRRGVGEALTRRRLEWIAERAREAFFFADAENRASIALHARFGFTEVTRDFHFPGTAFPGGTGILYRVELGERPRR